MARPGATLPPLPPKPANLFPVWSGLLIALFVVITRDLEITFEDLFWGLADMAEFLGRFDHPDFTELPRYLRLMGETLAMAAWGPRCRWRSRWWRRRSRPATCRRHRSFTESCARP